MPKTRDVILLVLGMTAVAIAAPWARRESQRNDAQAASQQSLDARLSAITHRDEPLARVIAQLEAQAGLFLHADWQRLREQGVDPDTRITVDLTQLRLSEALDGILDSAAEPAGSLWTPPARLDYAVEPDGRVTIRPQHEVAAETSVFEVYEVRRILGSEWLQRPHAPSPARMVENLLMDFGTPASWRDNWRHAVCRYRDGRVLVLQTPRRQLEIATLLETLKKQLRPDEETARLLRRLRGEGAS